MQMFLPLVFAAQCMYGLLTKCKVKMAGYRSNSFFCVLMGRDEVEVHKLAQKNEANIQPS